MCGPREETSVATMSSGAEVGQLRKRRVRRFMEHLRTLSERKSRRINAGVAVNDGLSSKRLQLVRNSDNSLEDTLLHVIGHAHLALDARKERSDAKTRKTHKRYAIRIVARMIFGSEGKVNNSLDAAPELPHRLLESWNFQHRISTRESTSSKRENDG